MILYMIMYTFSTTFEGTGMRRKDDRQDERGLGGSTEGALSDTGPSEAPPGHIAALRGGKAFQAFRKPAECFQH